MSLNLTTSQNTDSQENQTKPKRVQGKVEHKAVKSMSTSRMQPAMPINIGDYN